jgi:hypothetical protein
MVGGVASEGDFVEGHFDGSIIFEHGRRRSRREECTHLS